MLTVHFLLVVRHPEQGEWGKDTEGCELLKCIFCFSVFCLFSSGLLHVGFDRLERAVNARCICCKGCWFVNLFVLAIGSYTIHKSK